ncbi:hypothetical protein FHT44_004961 [Mycolicibacterium sp. BK634]|uniref:hypothetical protein n=1 Tax=Mycolicibacterium sp. BK634 TaxID=2587099 RepID=UPI00161417FC|nr:hypothetical protein [Mycolicibacterium sp. BK634]MBB3752449.1 hypothetical protein [Mycolicibacterium sp. BK634]
MTDIAEAIIADNLYEHEWDADAVSCRCGWVPDGVDHVEHQASEALTILRKAGFSLRRVS